MTPSLQDTSQPLPDPAEEAGVVAGVSSRSGSPWVGCLGVVKGAGGAVFEVVGGTGHPLPYFLQHQCFFAGVHARCPPSAKPATQSKARNGRTVVAGGLPAGGLTAEAAPGLVQATCRRAQHHLFFSGGQALCQ
mmetsp:Transcript_43434/g.135121  ORF Transcript_43434/g.135121 Transcript_43434/m.135121 type:complete len:134 (+) Transcript_43434:338-739(+)